MAAPACVVREVTAADVGALAALCTSAFEDNPAYASVFGLRGGADGGAHAAALHWLFERRVRLALAATGGHYLLCEEEAAAAETGGGGSTAGDACGAAAAPLAPARRVLAAVALVPHAGKAGLLHMLQVGLLEWPFRWGLPSLLRAFALDDAHEAAHATHGADAATPPLPPAAAELSMMAVSPEAQGGGLGSRLLRELLARWDDAGGGGVRLGTQREQNLRFYERVGFTLVCRKEEDGYPSWFMRREARGSGGGGEAEKAAAPAAAA
jgi:GNAT superfamily N-acetyltransferase